MGTDINFKNHLGRTYGTRIGLPAFDPAAQAYFDATGITGELQKAAINNLVLNLKKYNLWSKMKAVYPFVTDNRNLASYTEDFGNAYWTKANTTATLNATTAPNGSSTADLIIPSVLSAPHVIYTQPFIGGSQIVTNTIYAKAAGYNFIGLSDAATGQAVINLSNGTIVSQDAGITASTPVNVGNGWWRCAITFTATTNRGLGVDIWSDGSKTTFAGNGTSGVYLWGAQSELGSTATTYQPIATTQQAYIANQFKYNLKDPRDLDAAFRLVFNGGWTHSSTGATPNGTNGYANTYLSPSSVLAQNSASMGIYSRTNNASTLFTDYGAYDSYGFWQRTRRTNDTGGGYANTTSDQYTANTSSLGLFCLSRISSANFSFYKNGTGTLFTSTSTGITSLSIYIGAGNLNAAAVEFSNRQYAFQYISDGLTDDDATNLYYSTQVFQTTLGRQVGSPAYALPAVNDVNAKLYLSAINSSDPTVNGAVDTFISGLKTDGIYSKMKAVYPFVTDNRNLLGYTEDFSNIYWNKTGGSAIVSNTTTAPNGTTTADTFITASGSMTNRMVSSTLDIIGQTVCVSIYAKSDTFNRIRLSNNASNVISADFNLDTGTLVGTTGSVISTSVSSVGNGWYRCSMSYVATDATVLYRMPLITSGISSSIFVWGAQLELSSTTTTYQPQLGSAQSYFANQFKYNMINPQDDDSAFRLVFNGGWTHSPQGALPNGINGFANTFFTPNNLSQDNNAIGFYSRTNIIATQSDMGIFSGITNSINIGANYLGSGAFARNFNGSFGGFTNNDTTGLYINSRISASENKMYKNASLLGTITATSGTPPTAPNIAISGEMNIGNTTISGASSKQFAFAFMSDGFNSTEAANLYTRVQNLQTLLNRQV
jgi:hypothetical protein